MAGGDLEQTFDVTLVDDSDPEPNDQFEIRFVTANSDAVQANDTGLVTIVNDDDFIANLITVTDLVGDNVNPTLGEVVTFTTTIVNQGPQDATEVNLVNQIPNGLAATANHGQVTQGSYDPQNGFWNVGTIASGETATLTIEGVVTGPLEGPLLINLTSPAVSEEVDPTTDGDIYTFTVTIVAGLQLEDDQFSFDEDAGVQTLDVLANDSPVVDEILDVSPATLGVVSIAAERQNVAVHASGKCEWDRYFDLHRTGCKWDK